MINVERHIGAGSDRVWQTISGITNWAELLPTVQTVAAKPGVQRGERGARFQIKQPGLPSLVYEVTEWQPGTGFTWVAASPGVRTVGTHYCVATPDGCTLRLGIRWEGPFAGVVRLVYGRRTERFVNQEAEAFARFAEQGAS